MIAECIGTAWLEDHTGIGSLFDRRLDDPLPAILDITLALSASIGTAGAIRPLKIALMHSFSARWSFGTRQKVERLEG